MKFRMFTDALTGRKLAVNVERVYLIEVADKNANTTEIHVAELDKEFGSVVVEVSEDFDTVFSRLNTIAE